MSLNNNLSTNSTNLLSTNKSRSIKYEEVTENTDLSIYDFKNRFDLYKEFNTIINNSSFKEKKEHRNIIKSMLTTISKLSKAIIKRDLEIKDLKSSKINNNNANLNSNYDSFSNCVKKKKSENIFIIKKVNNDSNLDVKNELY